MVQWHRVVVVAGIALALLGVIGVAGSYVLWQESPGSFWQGLLADAGMQFLGMALTILVLDALYQRSQDDQLRRELVRQMGSQDNATAIGAANALQRRGWLRSGMMRGVDLTTANLAGLHLVRADLQGVVLAHAKLTEAKLIAVNLDGANLRDADLSKSMLYRTTFKGADLVNAKFPEAAIQNVDFSDAYLVGANFGAVQFERGLTFTGAGFGLQSTKWPEGFDPVAAGAVDRGDWSDALFGGMEEYVRFIFQGDEELMGQYVEEEEAAAKAKREAEDED
jgi:hypothetical protein